MKIAIPVDEKNITTGVCPSFGRTPYYMLHDTENNETIFIDNNAAQSAGGAGIKAAQTLIDNKVEILLTPRCGENAANVLLGAGVKMYKTVHLLALDNVTAYKNSTLQLLDNIHPGFHNHGNN